MILLITGGSGLVGYGLKKKLEKSNNYKTIFLSSKQCNLEDYNETYNFFKKVKPDYVIHLAANVGGLFKNMNDKVNMLEKNLSINSNVLKCCHLFNVKKVVSCLSTCIFPDNINYPIDETMLHLGPPHDSNYTYAYAKRILEIQSRAYQEQYNKDFICIIPTNIYGPNDNFSLTNGHVIPALIHNCYLSKKNNKDFIVKGSGKPLRQFIYNLDLAELIIWVLDEYKQKDSIILSVDDEDEISIKEVAYEIARIFDYVDRIKFDLNYSDGQYKKTVSNKKLKSLKIYSFTNIRKGLKESIQWFIENYEFSRK